ncbi:MAG: hypothetical protein EXQ50_08855 [Acidobacteria bacterium]|nr:hypothetical protein [Acidobacteriota bacterium]
MISLLNRPVGVERFDLRSTPQGFELTANMDVTERGSRLQLASTLSTTTDFTPTRFTSKGKPIGSRPSSPACTSCRSKAFARI